MIAEIYFEKLMRWLTVSLGILCVCFVSYALFGYEFTAPLEGRLIPAHMRGLTPWKTIFDDDIQNGATVPQHTNVIIHIPKSIEKIERKVLFGRRGEDVRYWGYCFPENYAAMKAMAGRGFPGRLFLSEKEREVRREEERQKRRASFTIPRDLKEERLNETEYNRGRIRHQMDIFLPGMSCYVMTEAPLPIGIDVDGDGANIFIEKENGSDPEVRDTDGDGIDDGTEILLLRTNPTMRDTDGDGIVDGLEDMNRNGKVDMGETDPRRRDSDRDGLCDGLCRAGMHGSELRGEDVNLNGVVDDGETDPRKADSDGDGILDEQEYFNCMIEGRDCKYSAFPI